MTERDQTSPIAPVAPSRSKSALSRPVERTFLSLSNYHASGLANSEADLYNIAGLDNITIAKRIAKQAIKSRKVFRLDGGHRYLRKALKARGWVEKFTNRTKRFQTGDEGDDPVDFVDDPIDDMKDIETKEEPQEIKGTLPLDEMEKLVSRALRDYEPDFQWMPTHRVDFKTLRPNIWINHFHKADFVTKTGLTERLKSTRWHSDRNPDEFFPKCYILGKSEDYDNFQEDFRRCAATSFLKYAADLSTAGLSAPGEKKKDFVDGKWLDFALEMTLEFYKDPDTVSSCASTIVRNVAVSNEDSNLSTIWDKFLKVFYQVAHQGFSIPGCIGREFEIEQALKIYRKHNAQHRFEGRKNLWIVKPGAMSRGRRISVYSNLTEIKDLIGPDLNIIASGKWVAQKYIERPLLIHDVKFDIRQWFVVTDWEVLTVWMYRKSYVRFSTVPFNLDSLDNQIHLTNNAIQRNFDISEHCHEEIPEEKMWYCDELDTYLKSIGRGNAYARKIFPAMKKILTQTCLAAQETAEPRKRSFELYGADFMLDEDLNPLLIEINQGPTLSISTAVTKDLVEQMLEDICKIVIDRQGQRDGEAGNFVKIFRQPYVDSPKYQGNSLSIEGKGYKRPRAPMKRYVQTIKVNKKDENENDSDADGGGGDDDTEITKSYTWDVDRINRLAQPRARYREELAKRKSEPTNSISTECRKAQPTTVFPDTSDNYRVQYEPTQYQAATISSSNKLQQVASNLPSSCHQEMPTKLSTKLSTTLSFEKEFQQIPKSPKKVTAKVSTKPSTKITKKTVLTSQQIRTKEYQEIDRLLLAEKHYSYPTSSVDCQFRREQSKSPKSRPMTSFADEYRYKILQTINPEPIRVTHRRVPNQNRIRKERNSGVIKTSPEKPGDNSYKPRITIGTGLENVLENNARRKFPARHKKIVILHEKRSET